MKRSYFVILGLALALALTGCSGAPSNAEDITNLLEAYVFAHSTGDTSAVAPDISGLKVEQKSDVVNAMSFDIVFGREKELIDLLDAQWLDWRSDDGYITSYLNNLIALEEKRLTSIEDTRKSVSVEATYRTVMDFYKGVGRALKGQGYEDDNLYVAIRSQAIVLSYDAEGMHLLNASAIVFDMKKSDYFTAVYAEGVLKLSPVDTREMSVDNIRVSKAQTIPFIERILPLIPPSEDGTTEVRYTFLKEKGSASYKKAVLKDDAFERVAVVKDVYEYGYLQLSSSLDVELPQFILYRPKQVAN